jgi:2-polyprenyl-3-methyl-5-hydroxy-6-metoxy-1,4-benzoquinol methylase
VTGTPPLVERERLERAAAWYDSRRGLNYDLVRSAAEMICERATGPRLLELGCAQGVMTRALAARFPEVVVVEGAHAHAETARAILGDPARVHHCLFEEFEPDRWFDDIVMAGVLEHVADPVGLLCRAARWLEAGGSLHIVVPNAESLHRRIGVALGMLRRLDELNEGDRAMGHRRVYTWDLLKAHIEEGGLQIVAREGNFLKPLSNAQMERWPQALREAFRAVGRDLPQLCAEIYTQCRPHAETESALEEALSCTASY